MWRREQRKSGKRRRTSWCRPKTSSERWWRRQSSHLLQHIEALKTDLELKRPTCKDLFKHQSIDSYRHTTIYNPQGQTFPLPLILPMFTEDTHTRCTLFDMFVSLSECVLTVKVGFTLASLELVLLHQESHRVIERAEISLVCFQCQCASFWTTASKNKTYSNCH